jgi:hypothetical protein
MQLMNIVSSMHCWTTPINADLEDPCPLVADRRLIILQEFHCLSVYELTRATVLDNPSYILLRLPVYESSQKLDRELWVIRCACSL